MTEPSVEAKKRIDLFFVPEKIDERTCLSEFHFIRCESECKQYLEDMHVQKFSAKRSASKN